MPVVEPFDDSNRDFNKIELSSSYRVEAVQTCQTMFVLLGRVVEQMLA